jgi:2-oxoglutarate dehydrogenase E1 component
MSPKNLLRHKDCKSNLSEFDDLAGHPGFDKQGTRFKRLIKDQNNHKDLEEGINRLVLCSGKVGCHPWKLYFQESNVPLWQVSKRVFDLFFLLWFQVYYELDEERRKTERTDVAICRVEQLCPFPYDLIQRELKRYPSMFIRISCLFLLCCMVHNSHVKK